MSQRAHDRRPLSPGFRGTCRATREGGGLPEGSIIPAGITHDLVLLIDLPAHRMEREERLLAMNGGDVTTTLIDICIEGGGKDVRFLLAHGADVNHVQEGGGPALWHAARNNHLMVVTLRMRALVSLKGLFRRQPLKATRTLSLCCSTAERIYTTRTTMRCTGRQFTAMKTRCRSFSTGAQLCGRMSWMRVSGKDTTQ